MAVAASSLRVLLQRIGNLVARVRLCIITGYLAIVERHYEDALAWLEEARTASHRLSNPTHEFAIRENLGLAHLFLDQLDDAAASLRGALVITREAGAERLIDEALLALAAVVARQGNLDRAARLAGAANAISAFERNHAEQAVWNRLEQEILAVARARCGPVRWERAARQGASLDLAAALEMALAG